MADLYLFLRIRQKQEKGSRILGVFCDVLWTGTKCPCSHLLLTLRPATSSMVSLKDIQNARSLLHRVAVRTPLVLCKLPSDPQMQMQKNDRQIFIKPENLQPVGSFKLRGAYKKISSLTPD